MLEGAVMFLQVSGLLLESEKLTLSPYGEQMLLKSGIKMIRLLAEDVGKSPEWRKAHGLSEVQEPEGREHRR